MRQAIRQSLLLLVICGLFELFAGEILHQMVDGLLLPGIIVLVPALLGMKGNIETTLGSRLGSAAHMGLITKDDILNAEMRENILGSLFLTIVMSLLAGILAVVTCFLLGIDGVRPVAIILVSLFAGTLAGMSQAGITVGVIFVAFKRGYDPDNVTGPALATMGDLITIAYIALCVIAVKALGGVVGFV